MPTSSYDQFRETPLVSDSRNGWPTLDPAARYGLVGAFLLEAEPYTEADPVGLLICLLAEFGAVVGMGPHMLAGNARHPARVSPVLVGATAKSRKSTGQGQVRALGERAWPAFASRVMGGFGSGEAVVDEVRDPDGDDVGAHDPRLLVWEPEFARVLRVCNRDGSVLSMVMRHAYDGLPLSTKARARKVTATTHHIVTVGAVTCEELRSTLTTTEAASGFANRHLFMLVRRVRRLSDGGNIPDDILDRFAARLAIAVAQSRAVDRMTWTAEALARWEVLYEVMADDDPGGLLGSIVARPEANVMRLAVTYALLDGLPTIARAHLDAAWAVWQYARQSAEVIFADLSGDPDVDRLVAELRQAGARGLEAAAVERLMGGHGKGRAVTERAVRRGLVVVVDVPSGGRPRKMAFLPVCAPAEKADKAEEGTGR